jgi:uncharacterized membrane protein YbhN (UPF0104 family)
VPESSPIPIPGGGRRRIPWVRLALTVGVLALLFTWLPAGEIWGAMAKTGPALWCAVLLAAVAAHLVAAEKWRRLVIAAGCRPSFAGALAAHGAGLFANNWLPSMVGGDVIRAGVVARRHHVLAPPAVAGVADRVIDLATSLILAALGLLALRRHETGPALAILGWGTLAMTVGGFSGLLLLRTPVFSRLPPPLARRIRRLRSVSAELAAQPRATVLAAVLSVAVQFALVYVNVLLAKAIGIEAGLAAWLVAFPLAKIAALAPISLGGLGVREGVLSLLLAPFGAAPALAVAQGFVWRTILLGLGLVGGLLYLAIPRSADPEPKRAAA